MPFHVKLQLGIIIINFMLHSMFFLCESFGLQRSPPSQHKISLEEIKFSKFYIILNTMKSISGWQYQQSPPTIQCILEKALTQATKLERKDLLLVGASRTDKGVHALGQV